MLEHANSKPSDPTRVVIIGSRGLIGKAALDMLVREGVDVAPVSSGDLNLLDADAADRLAGMMRADDSVVMFSALTPDKGRDIATLMKNLKMAEAVCSAIERTGCRHVIYISSDAVYPFSSGMVSETSPAAPSDLYGVMHRAREIMFENTVKDAPLAILRCTMVLAETDTHNSYGPNRFRRQAAEQGKIVLGGNGEETRDHILIDDVAQVIRRVLSRESRGILNVASGRSVSFLQVAEMVSRQFSPAAEIVCTERKLPITHRHFAATEMRRAFPEQTFTTLEDGVAAIHRAAFPEK